MKKMLVGFLLSVTFLFFGVQRSEAGIPLLNIEGSGGGAIVPWAYLINPPKDGQQIGMPSAGAWYWTSSDYDFYFLNAAISPHKRVELGITYGNLNVSELRSDLKSDSFAGLGATLDAGEDDLGLITAHVKLLLVEETPTLPAIAVSAEYKKALDVDDLDSNLTRDVRALGGAFATAPSVLKWMGYDDDSGVDFNIMATKLWTTTPKPILASLNIRATKSNQTGFLGFSDEWSINPEATLAFLPKPYLIVGVEYRTKPDELKSLNDYLNGNFATTVPNFNDYSFEEEDFIDLFAVYLPPSIPGLTLTVGVANIGNIVHEDVSSIWAFNAKYDF